MEVVTIERQEIDKCIYIDEERYPDIVHLDISLIVDKIGINLLEIQRFIWDKQIPRSMSDKMITVCYHNQRIFDIPEDVYYAAKREKGVMDYYENAKNNIINLWGLIASYRTHNKASYEFVLFKGYY